MSTQGGQCEQCGEELVKTVLVKTGVAPAGVAQWTERWPVNLRVASSIPSQGTCLGSRPGPQ